MCILKSRRRRRHSHCVGPSHYMGLLVRLHFFLLIYSNSKCKCLCHRQVSTVIIFIVDRVEEKAQHAQPTQTHTPLCWSRFSGALHFPRIKFNFIIFSSLLFCHLPFPLLLRKQKQKPFGLILLCVPHRLRLSVCALCVSHSRLNF